MTLEEAMARIESLEESLDRAVDAINDARSNQCPEFIDIVNDNGDVIARAIREFDAGEPCVMYMPNGDPGYPGIPGHDYWRFATLKEMTEVNP